VELEIGKKRAFGFAALATVLSILAVTLTPIGPLFVYGWLVPIISPLIPKPEDVPSRANAEYHWKGFGLIWYWEDPVSGGCARWFATESGKRPVRGLHVFEGGKTCEEGEQTMSRLSFLDHMTFGTSNNESPYEECPFRPSVATLGRYLIQIEELKNANSGTIERKMLGEMRDEIAQIDRVGLRAQQYGCRIGQI
jgi:hypothetical protein